MFFDEKLEAWKQKALAAAAGGDTNAHRELIVEADKVLAEGFGSKPMLSPCGADRVVQTWISVDERLPDAELKEKKKKFSRVYDIEVFAHIAGASVATTLRYDGHVFEDAFGDQCRVVRWAPLPKLDGSACDRWIYVDKRLPDDELKAFQAQFPDEEEIEVVAQIGNAPLATAVRYRGNGYFFGQLGDCLDGVIADKVTRWMPMPSLEDTPCDTKLVVQTWTSVNDRLPDEELNRYLKVFSRESGMEVLVRLEDSLQATSLEYKGNGVFADTNGMTFDEVSSWMLMPDWEEYLREMEEMQGRISADDRLPDAELEAANKAQGL
jgi:hypothetical protein